MNSRTPDTALLTWLDIERHFKSVTENYTRFEPGILGIRCFADGVEIEHSCSVDAVRNWLASIFGHWVSNDRQSIILHIGSHPYPIFLQEPIETDSSPPRSYPLWRDQAYLETPFEDLPPPWNSGPHVVAFHSFKGGVGRTTALMTYASARLNISGAGPVRILLVDADLEAPGISFWLPEENRPTVSFIKLLEALHYPPIDTETSLNYFAAELRKTSLNVGSANREIFVLPAALDVAEIMDMPIQPEHIARNPTNPWLLTDHLHELGRKLDVDVVFMDLRAGLSELASPFLFDPRVEHFFVTTVAPQSVNGMAEVLRRLHSFQGALKEEARTLAKPSLVVSLLTAQLKQLPVYTRAVECLNNAFPAQNDDAISAGVEWLEAEFSESLMSIGTIRQALELLPSSSLYKAAESWASSRNVIAQGEKPRDASNDDARKRAVSALNQTCERFQFAEKATSDDMLVTDPLRNLAKHYTDELPNTVSVGAKGAGKTFTFMQICRTQNWHDFLSKLGQTPQRVSEGVIYPFLVSTNVEKESLKIVNEAREACRSKIGFTPPIGENSITRRITAGLRNPETDWDGLWERLILDELHSKATVLEELNAWLLKNNKSIVLVIDGVEDLFDAPEEKESQKAAIKALLQLPNRLNELKERRIGLVCFVRADYVQAVIRQNLAQYLSRFQAFKLEWTPESFLRLAYWICGKAGVIDANPEEAGTLTTDQLLKNLEKLWGKKMGNNGSKEAMTARWVFAALCDLNGRLQARDLVRFLKFSSQEMMKPRQESWPDRLLFPEAIRKSLPNCSADKVQEAAKEIRVLRQWQESLQKVPPENLKIPFDASAVNLTSEVLSALKELGIIYEDMDQLSERNRFYLPEIYRYGLNFQSAVVGRPRVQALLKRNLGGMPF